MRNRAEEALKDILSTHFPDISPELEELCVVPQTLVTDLSSTCCLGKKQFEREFCLHVGMNPKEYSRIVRFQKALKQEIFYQKKFLAQIIFIKFITAILKQAT